MYSILPNKLMELGYMLPLQVIVEDTSFAIPENFVISQKGDQLRGQQAKKDDPAGTWMNQGLGGDSNTIDIAVKLVDATGRLVQLEPSKLNYVFNGEPTPFLNPDPIRKSTSGSCELRSNNHDYVSNDATNSLQYIVPIRASVYYSKYDKVSENIVDAVHLGVPKDKNSRRIGKEKVICAVGMNPLGVSLTEGKQTLGFRILQTSVAHKRNKFVVEVWPDIERLQQMGLNCTNLFQNKQQVVSQLTAQIMSKTFDSKSQDDLKKQRKNALTKALDELRIGRASFAISVMSKINKKKTVTVEKKIQQQLESATAVLKSTFMEFKCGNNLMIGSNKSSNPTPVSTKPKGSGTITKKTCTLDANDIMALYQECCEIKNKLSSEIERRKRIKLETNIPKEKLVSPPATPDLFSIAQDFEDPDFFPSLASDAAAILGDNEVKLEPCALESRTTPAMTEESLGDLLFSQFDGEEKMDTSIHEFDSTTTDSFPSPLSFQPSDRLARLSVHEQDRISEEKQASFDEDEVFEALKSAFDGDSWDISIIRCSLSPEGLFFTLDVSKEGWLNEGEVSNALKVLGIPLNNDIAKVMMRLCDKNKDGKVTQDEFIEYIHHREDQLSKIFAELDSNNDGLITMDELREARGSNSSHVSLTNSPEEHLHSLFSWMSSVVGKVSKSGNIAGGTTSIKRKRTASDCREPGFQSMMSISEEDSVDFEGFKTSLTLLPPSISLGDLAYLLYHFS